MIRIFIYLRPVDFYKAAYCSRRFIVATRDIYWLILCNALAVLCICNLAVFSVPIVRCYLVNRTVPTALSTAYISFGPRGHYYTKIGVYLQALTMQSPRKRPKQGEPHKGSAVPYCPIGSRLAFQKNQTDTPFYLGL